MKRIVSETKIGDTKVRYRVRIEDEESAQGSEAARIRQYHFLRELADNQILLCCGFSIFEQLKIFHAGTCWVAEMEAVVDEGPHG